MRESALEGLLYDLVRRAGGIAIKLAPIHAGVPDRLVLLPNGHIYLVELKSDIGQVDPAQRLWHSRSAACGHPVVVLKGRKAVENWVKEVVAQH